MTEQEAQKELAQRVGHVLSEIIDDAAPLNERYYVMGAERAIEKFGLVERSRLSPRVVSEVTEPGKALAEKASRHELRDGIFVRILERLRKADDRDGPRHYEGNRAEAAGELYEAARAHFSPRVVVAAPSATDRKELVGIIRNAPIYSDISTTDESILADAILTWMNSRTSQPVQVEVTDEMIRETVAALMDERDSYSPESVAYLLEKAIRAALSAALGGKR